MHFNLQQHYFDLILSGRKTAEGRLYKPKLHELSIGDTISFSPNDDVNTVAYGTVTYVHVYGTFQEMLETGSESLALLPDVLDTTDAVNIYESFGKFKEDQFKHGVISIGFSLN